MFSDFFLSIINLSITASYVILAVLLLRLALKGMPKKFSYILWSVVGFRLVCPVTFQSIFSLFSLKPFNMERVQSGSELTFVADGNVTNSGKIPEFVPGISVANNFVYDTITTSTTYEENIKWVWLVFTGIWLVGMAVLLVYSAVRFIKLKKSLTTSIRIDGNIYQSENITTPFIIGIIKPKIYIPSGINESYKEYVLAHERHHLRRFDNIIKLFAFVLLTLHWFNPLVWLAFYLMTKDMEMSCDEYVLSHNEGIKKTYSTALLSFASNKKFPMPSPVSFSENGVKGRIKNILKFKKPKKAVQAIAIILCLALLTACAANPKETVTQNDITERTATGVFTAGKVIATQPAVSWARENGADFGNITLKKDSLTVEHNHINNAVFESEKMREETLRTEETAGDLVIYAQAEHELPICINSDYKDLFLNGDITCTAFINKSIKVKSQSGLKQDDNRPLTYLVYYKDGTPFAFCDLAWIYLLEPWNKEQLVSDAILAEEHKGDEYYDAKYLTEGHEVFYTRDGDLNGKNKDKFKTVYLVYCVERLSVKDTEFGKELQEVSAYKTPAAIVFERSGDTLNFNAFWTPRDGTDYSKDLKKYFPQEAYDKLQAFDASSNYILEQRAYASFIEQEKLNPDELIATAFELYNNEEDFEPYHTLLYLGNYTVKYIYKQFLNGKGEHKEGLQEYYIKVLKDLIGDEQIKYAASSPQDYFDAFLKHSQELLKENDEEFMKEYCPYSYMLLELNGDIDDEKETETENNQVKSGNIYKISVELFNHSEKVFEGKGVNQIAEVIDKAKLTKQESVQDTPDVEPLGKIIINDEEETIYYYQKSDKFYLEKPYVGIYETTVDIDVLLSEL